MLKDEWMNETSQLSIRCTKPPNWFPKKTPSLFATLEKERASSDNSLGASRHQSCQNKETSLWKSHIAFSPNEQKAINSIYSMSKFSSKKNINNAYSVALKRTTRILSPLAHEHSIRMNENGHSLSWWIFLVKIRLLHTPSSSMWNYKCLFNLNIP